MVFLYKIYRPLEVEKRDAKKLNLVRYTHLWDNGIVEGENVD